MAARGVEGARKPGPFVAERRLVYPASRREADHVWFYDFVHHRTHDSRALRMLYVLDEFTPESLAIRVWHKLSTADGIDVLTDLFIVCSIPGYIRSDNGRETVNTPTYKLDQSPGAGQGAGRLASGGAMKDEELNERLTEIETDLRLLWILVERATNDSMNTATKIDAAFEAKPEVADRASRRIGFQPPTPPPFAPVSPGRQRVLSRLAEGERPDITVPHKYQVKCSVCGGVLLHAFHIADGVNYSWLVDQEHEYCHSCQSEAEGFTKHVNNLADMIRAFACEHYIEPARRMHRDQVELRMGDVHAAMKLRNALPAVCSALQAAKFRDECRVELTGQAGPHQGANRLLTFKVHQP